MSRSLSALYSWWLFTIAALVCCMFQVDAALAQRDHPSDEATLGDFIDDALTEDLGHLRIQGQRAHPHRSIPERALPERALLRRARPRPIAFDDRLPLRNDFRDHNRGFGRIFPPGNEIEGDVLISLRPEALRRLGETTVERRPRDPEGDGEMPAGYTFFGQFIDHDITLDTTSMLGQFVSDDDFINARTPALDLDSVYGRGPDQDPHLYRLPYLRVGRRIAGCGLHARYDLLRVSHSNAPGPAGGAARALIGDPRNDENFVIAQLHAAFVAFHNVLVDLIAQRRYGGRGNLSCRRDGFCDTHRLALSLPDREQRKIFEEARDHVIHYYHRTILEDFLPRTIGERRVIDLLRKGRHFYFPERFKHKRDAEKAFIPVEFAVAAFRYGHSQVRQDYFIRADRRVDLFDVIDRQMANQPVSRDLLIDWGYFFELNRRKPRGFNFARKLDTKIVPALHDLGRAGVVGRRDVVSLPARNLDRARVFRLPSGQAVAEFVLPALHRDSILHGAGLGPLRHGPPSWTRFMVPPDRRVRQILRRDRTPLWYYILQEAERFGAPSRFGYGGKAPSLKSGRVRFEGGYVPARSLDRRKRGLRYYTTGGHTLGPVGGTLVGEVLAGLLEAYHVQTGKGLGYSPLISASTGRDRRSPLSLTPMPHLHPKYHGRYLLSNLLIDAGQAAPVSRAFLAGRQCGYQ